MDVTHKIVFTFLGINVRDTVVYTWILMALMIAFVFLLRKRLPSMMEMIFDLVNGVVGGVLSGDDLIEYRPLLGSIFLFILSANLISLIPRMKSPTADVNTTFAIAFIVFCAVHYYGVKRKGLWRYLKEFSSPPWLFPLEIISQFSRTLSLTLRLFGNVLSGDMIVAITFSLIPLIVPIPMIAISAMSGVIQAFILTTLASLYISSAVEIAKDDEKIKKIKLQEKLRKVASHV